MAGLIVLSEELGTDQKQLGTEWILGAGGREKHPRPLSLGARAGKCYRHRQVDRQRLCKELSTAYPQIRPRVIHNCPVDSQICNTFPV